MRADVGLVHAVRQLHGALGRPHDVGCVPRVVQHCVLINLLLALGIDQADLGDAVVPVVLEVRVVKDLHAILEFGLISFLNLHHPVRHLVEAIK